MSTLMLSDTLVCGVTLTADGLLLPPLYYFSIITFLKVYVVAAAAVPHLHVTAHSLLFTLIQRLSRITFTSLWQSKNIHWIFLFVIILCTKPLYDFSFCCFLFFFSKRPERFLTRYKTSLLFFLSHVINVIVSFL